MRPIRWFQPAILNIRLLHMGFIVLFSLGQTWSQTQPMWTLEACISEALKYSPRLQAAREQLNAVESSAYEARANRWPVFSLGGTYAYTSEVQELHLNLPLPAGVQPPHIRFGDGNVYDYTLNARMPIYAGGATEARARAEQANFRAADADLAAEHAKLIYEVRRAYFNVLGAEARIENAGRLVDRLKRHLAELEGAQRIGTASRESVIMTEARLTQAEQSLILAQADALTQRLNLGRWMGRPNEAILTTGVLDGLLLPEIEADSIATRAEILAFDARIAQSRQLTRAARGSLFPSLSGSATYHYAKPGVDFVQNDWMNYYTLGLNLQWTLWDWKARGHRVQQALATQRVLEARKQEFLLFLEQQKITSRRSLEAANEALAKAEQRVALEQERSKLIAGRYQLGAATEQEYLDAQDDLASAETDVIAQRVRARLAEVELLYAGGR